MDDLLKGSGLEHLLGDGMTHRESVLKRYNLADKSYSLKELSTISKVPLDILQQVFNRGVGAAKTQPNSIRLKGSFVKNVKAPRSAKLSDDQWGFSRVYSFLNGNPKHDNDLRENKEKVGGLKQNVAFVRKAMAKTKKINNGYRPPARAGYDFPIAMEKDKPSKHIQMNIGRVPADEVEVFKYNRKKASDKTEEQKERDRAMKPAYWGLSWDDFEEIDGELVEKKHGLLWRPIYFKPAGKEEGCWGLRCCRYDKKGKEIPTAKKYEWIYFREQDDCGNVALEPKKTPTTDANPPETITNTLDGDDVVLDRNYARANNNRFDMYGARDGNKKPYYWFSTDEKGWVENPQKNPTYEDIPVIISANNAIEGFMKTYMYGKANWNEPYLLEQKKRWEEHLDNLERTDRQGEMDDVLQQIRENPDEMRGNPRVGKILRKSFSSKPYKVPVSRVYKQEGTYRSKISNNKWGKDMAEKRLERTDERIDFWVRLLRVMSATIGANNKLIEVLIENPMGEDLDYEKILKDSDDAGYGMGKDEDIAEYDRADGRRFVKEAEDNLKKLKTENQ